MSKKKIKNTSHKNSPKEKSSSGEKKQKKKEPYSVPSRQGGRTSKGRSKKKTRKSKWDLSKLSTQQKIKYGAFLILGILVLAAIGVYAYGPLNRLTYPIFKQVPFPVAIVGENKTIITSRELVQNTEAVKKFYESQDYATLGLRVDFSTDEGKLRLKVKQRDVLDKMIENHIVEQEANNLGIYISKDDAENEIKSKVEQYGNKKSLVLSLKSLYGWSMNDFRDNVVIYQMYLKELAKKHENQAKNSEDYKKIKTAKNELNKNGSNFSQVVRKYSEGESAKNDGELGWFSKEQLIPEVADAVFGMNQGEISKIIISPLGFHIVMLEQKRVVDGEEIKEDNKMTKAKEEVKIKQIFVRGESFMEWFAKQKKNAPVVILMKEYQWDANSGQVRFSDMNMQKVEEKLRIKSEGDPSI